MMQDMMKGQITGMLPMVVIGAVINWVFSGFLTSTYDSFAATRYPNPQLMGFSFRTVKVPFPLTPRYKGMLQRGVELSTLSSSW